MDKGGEPYLVAPQRLGPRRISLRPAAEKATKLKEGIFVVSTH